MSETANGTKKPVIPQGALEAWAVQWPLFIQDLWEFQVKAAIWKRWCQKFQGAPCKTQWRSSFRSYKCITYPPKHVLKSYKSAFKFDLNLILKGVLPLQNSKTGIFQNSWKITYFSNISVTCISVRDINLGSNNPQSELTYHVMLIFKKLSNFACHFSWTLTMFLANFGWKYCSNTVLKIKWPPLFHIWAV